MGKKWWLLQHTLAPEQGWHPVRVFTVFGVPLCTAFYRARGPFPTLESAVAGATQS